MSNELTHGLAAGAAASVLSILAGEPAISTHVFFAGFVGMLINLDRGGAMNGKRTPYGHSLAFGIFWLYVAAICVYFLHIFGMLAFENGIWYLAGFGCGYFSHLAFDIFSDEGIFIMPLSKGVASQDWENWTRLSVASVSGTKAGMSNGELNMALVSVMMACIALA